MKEEKCDTKNWRKNIWQKIFLYLTTRYCDMNIKKRNSWLLKTSGTQLHVNHPGFCILVRYFEFLSFYT